MNKKLMLKYLNSAPVWLKSSLALAINQFKYVNNLVNDSVCDDRVMIMLWTNILMNQAKIIYRLN